VRKKAIHRRNFPPVWAAGGPDFTLLQGVTVFQGDDQKILKLLAVVGLIDAVVALAVPTCETVPFNRENILQTLNSA
jgi:hypothetical protein